jgi:hypothetical protein
MKKYILFVLCYCFVLKGNSQTTSSAPIDFGSIKQWDLKSGDTLLGKVFSVEKGKPELVFYPKQSDFTHKTLIITGTYTSDDNKVAGSALNADCNQVGNPTDLYFKPNAYLSFSSNVNFSKTSTCNSIPVYQLIDNGVIQEDVITARSKSKTQWRFFIIKHWTETFDNGSTLKGIDYLIADFDISISISDACKYVKAMERNRPYDRYLFQSTISACLLDTGAFRGFLLNGEKKDGNFPAKQSNVIIIN